MPSDLGWRGGKGERLVLGRRGGGFLASPRIAKRMGAGGDEARAPGIWEEGWGMFGIAWCCLAFRGWG
jgi:hypothetical protein